MMSFATDAMHAATAAQVPSQALDGLLRRMHFRSDVFFRNKLCDDWFLDTSGTGRFAFHIVSAGQCWLHLPDSAVPVMLGASDVVIFPHDLAHVLSARADRPPFGALHMPNKVALDAPMAGVSLLCGYVETDLASRRLLLAGLPQTILIRPRDGVMHEHLAGLLKLMFSEAAAAHPGCQALLDRLADALLLSIVRYAVCHHQARLGLLAALVDRQLGPLIQALVSGPVQDWTLGSMCAFVHMSRSALVQRFQELLGMSPIMFLLDWRMREARCWLQEGKMNTQTISERAGYASEAAFAKAFKRFEGAGPGEYRRRFQVPAR